MLVIYDTVSDIPDIIIEQVLEFESFPSTHLTCVPFLSVVAVKLKLIVSPGLLILTIAAVNPVLATLLTCWERIVAMGLLFDGGEYQYPKAPVIVQMISPCVCGHTPWLQSKFITEGSMFTIRNKLQINYKYCVIIY